MLIHNALITGSLLVNGTGYNTGSFSGSFSGAVAGTTATSSYVEYSNVANKPALVSGSSQITYSDLTGIPSGIVSGSSQISEFGIFATTGSNGFNGSQSITGSLTVTGQVVAQTLNVQQVTSSIVYSSGSNIFGNSLANTQQFTGSVGVTGSLTVTTSGTELQVTNTGVNLGNALTDSHIISGSITINPGGLFVSGSGNVGIGTTSPAQKLQINGPLALGNLAEDFTTNQEYAYPIVYAGNLSGLGNGELVIQPRTTATRSIRFVTRTSGAVSSTNPDTRMIIRWDGNVGIGTASPSRTLHILGASGIGTVLKLEGASGTTTYLQLAYNGATDGQSGYIGYDSSANMSFFTSNTERMRITSAGSVLVGATAGRGGGSTGHLFKQPSGDVYFELMADTSTAQNDILFSPASTGAYGIVGYDHSNNSMRFFANSSERMRIASDGSVGMGETSPSNGALSIKADWPSGYSTVKVYPSTALGSGGVAGYGIFDSNGSTRQVVLAANNTQVDLNVTANKPLLISTNDTERMRIAAGGDVTISGGALLMNGSYVRIATSGGSTVSGYLLRAGSWIGGGSSNANLALAAETGNGIYFYVNGSSSGPPMILTSGGNVGIGTTSPSFKLSVDGGDIKLNSGNASANYYLYLNKKEGQDGGILLQRDNANDWQITNIGTSGNLIFYSYGSSACAMTIARASGNVGIGTVPVRTLHVAGQAAFDMSTAGVVVQDSSGCSQIVSYKQTGATYHDLHLRGANLGIVINGSTGNVGINTTSPSSRLSVCSTTACSTVVDVQGCAGQLFSITDNLVGEIFAVSDISGIPILSVNSNGIVSVDSKIAVGANHTVSGAYATVTGGIYSRASGACSTVSGGYCNIASGPAAVISGGYCNTSSCYNSTIGGGQLNSALSFDSTVSGGAYNTANAACSTVGGGCGNIASGAWSTVSGGRSNTASGYCSAVLGGACNTAACACSAAATNSQTTTSTCQFRVNNLSKASGTFRIDHPNPAKKHTHYLSHSFVESPTAGDNIYRYKVSVVNGQAVITLPSYYKYLNENDQIWVTPQGHFGIGYGIINVEQTQLTIYGNTDGEYNVLLIGTRKDFDAVHHWQGVETYK